LKRYPKALEALNHAITINPENFLAWEEELLLFEEQQRYEEALNAVKNAIAIEPNNALVWVYKGDLHLFHLKQYNEALEAYEHAIALNRNSTYAWEGRARALQALGRDSKTREAEEQAKKPEK